MEEARSGFWSGLFRSKSNAQANRLFKGQSRKVNESSLYSRRRNDGPTPTSSRRRPRRAPPPVDVKGKGRADANGDVYDDLPLSGWPPSGVSSEEELPLGHAIELISRGVPAHRGHKRPIPHRSDQYYALYATTAGNRGDETDCADLHDSMTQLTTLRIQGSGVPKYPWETLEQPSLAFGRGARPGTITLNHWACIASNIPPAIELRDPGVKPRNVGLDQIFERLLELEGGLEEDKGDALYRNLYKRFLKDPDKIFNPHKSMDRQITDLIMVLSSPDWIDFTIPKNQVATRFIFDTSPENSNQYHKFFHQLLLSLELELRINAGLHNDWAKEKLMGQIPPRIQWNLALARRWRDYVRVGEFGESPEKVRMRFKLRKRQAKMLKRFAQMMKWPNLEKTLDALKENEAEGNLLSLSSHTMAFFSGIVLPGSTFPFLLMNTLVDIDPDEATDDLALLTHLHPNCGFQYRSYTYWSSSCIIGKVLAPTCLEVGGWVGPARPTPDLKSSQIARIRSRRPCQRITPEDVVSISERSDPLGPPAEVFPVREYKLVAPDISDFVDTVRIELLSLRGTMPARQDHGPQWYDASLQFAIDGVSWPLRLNYDVSYINAWPCTSGPHPLFFDYVYTSVRVDELVNIRDWGNPAGLSQRSLNSMPVGGNKPASHDQTDDDDIERVLVVDAFGAPDNEVLARAWCAHWGLSAVVADIRKICMACAIREAYAATMTVVILVEDQQVE